MTWTNPLDKLPSISQPYANHIIYGGILAFLVAVVTRKFVAPYLIDQYPFLGAPLYYWRVALVVTATVAILKKGFDYFLEHESLSQCNNKALATMIVPLVAELSLEWNWL